MPKPMKPAQMLCFSGSILKRRELNRLDAWLGRGIDQATDRLGADMAHAPAVQSEAFQPAALNPALERPRRDVQQATGVGRPYQ